MKKITSYFVMVRNFCRLFAVLALTLSKVLITLPVFALAIFSITSSVFPYVCLVLRLYMAYFVPLLLRFVRIIYFLCRVCIILPLCPI